MMPFFTRPGITLSVISPVLWLERFSPWDAGLHQRITPYCLIEELSSTRDDLRSVEIRVAHDCQELFAQALGVQINR